MNRNIKTRLFTLILSGLVLTSTLFTPGFGPNAEAKSKKHGKSAVTYDGERPVHRNYPRLFDIVGRLDRMTDDEAVIADSFYRISPTAAFHTPRQHNALQSRIQVGDVVGCLTDSNGEIQSMWLITVKIR